MAFVIGLILGFYFGVGLMCVMRLSSEQNDSFWDKK